LKGFGGAHVLQITSNLAGNTYRTVYTVQLKGVIYVLHAFQKKSTQGIKTSMHDIYRIKARLKTAIELHAETKDEQGEKHKKQR
jgi:phage-related protein